MEDMQEVPIQPVFGSSVETVVEDPGYDHEGPGDVCGYVHPAQGRTEDAQVALCRTCAGGAGYLLGYNLVKMWC